MEDRAMPLLISVRIVVYSGTVFGDIAGFCAPDPTPPIFHANFGVHVFPLHQIARVGVSPSRNLKLISREIISEVFQPV